MHPQRRFRGGDPIRVALLLAVGAWALAASPSEALPLALMLPLVGAIRLLPAPELLDAGLCLVVAVAQTGALFGLTETTAWWDAAAHVMTSALLAAVLVSAGGGPRAAVIAVAALGLGWEGVEWGSDRVFGTELSPGLADTVADLAVDAVGAVVGAWAAARRLRRGDSGSGRRPSAPGRWRADRAGRSTD